MKQTTNLMVAPVWCALLSAVVQAQGTRAPAFNQERLAASLSSSPAEWENRKTELAATESRRQQIERATVDAVQAGEERSERDHGFQDDNSTTGFFEGRKSRAAQEGWFSYTLKVVSDKPVTLVCTYGGSEGRRRVFDLLIDGQKVATQSLEIHPTELFDIEYPLPEALTRGKERVTIKFQAHPEAGSVLDVRIVQLGAEKR